MEIIEVKSGHSLISNNVANRPAGAHSYKINAHQYVATYRHWARTEHSPAEACGIMTLDCERIWLTAPEGKQIADAISAALTPVILKEETQSIKNASV